MLAALPATMRVRHGMMQAILQVFIQKKQKLSWIESINHEMTHYNLSEKDPKSFFLCLAEFHVNIDPREGGGPSFRHWTINAKLFSSIILSSGFFYREI